MPFNEEGFLSSDLAAWITGAENQFRDWFDMVSGLNRDAMRLLDAIQPPSVRNPELTALLLYLKGSGNDEQALKCRWDLANHSPEWGYGGSGPSQLALSQCRGTMTPVKSV